MKMLLISLSVFLLSLFLTCNRKSTAQTENRSRVHLLANELFDSPFEIDWNDSLSYAIIVKRIESKSPSECPAVHFAIFDKVQDSILFMDQIKQGQVEWLDTYRVRVANILDRKPMPKSLKQGYIYHVPTGKKSKFLTK